MSESNLQSCFDALSAVSTLRFRIKPQTESAIRIGLKLVDSFFHLSKENRKEVLDIIDQTLGQKLMSLGTMLVEKALADRDQSLLEAALTMHLIEGFRNDPRENIRYLVIISDAAKRMEVDTLDIWSKISNFATEHSEKQIRLFMQRPPEMNSISMFGMKLDMVDGHLKYRPIHKNQ